MYLIGKELFNEKVGLLAAAILSIFPDYLFNALIIYPDCLFICLILTNFLLFLRGRIVLSFIILAMAVYVKPIAIFLPVVYLIYFVTIKLHEELS
jgi:4-amino-4-deoxy-L-arabinose transferase-like glycosyltransferase